ncbi:hypothetical protein [Nocardioides sp. GY 10127]|uniref:hypothetical protein n=1 Tax=Nocardioides sp. GY 10127 TaxID=2569762 RepID=UPI0010A75CAF|nr:hypothetical protein [Nocardioides sp. GY 10127]TIC86643.1 hypothetical protein E8D37_01795 [Nocardioides sp. GY 10127]
MEILLRLGEKVPVNGRLVTVTELAHQSLPRLRAYLVHVAREGTTRTYGQVVEDLALPYLPRGLGRLLDLVNVDCQRRREPSLAALVVNQSGEVGSEAYGDPVAERAALRRYWLTHG